MQTTFFKSLSSNGVIRRPPQIAPACSATKQRLDCGALPLCSASHASFLSAWALHHCGPVQQMFARKGSPVVTVAGQGARL